MTERKKPSGLRALIDKARFRGITAGMVIQYILVTALMVFAALPLVYLVCSAFKPIDEILRFPPNFIVEKPTLANFRQLFLSLNSSTVPFLRYVFNSLFVTVVTVILSLIVCALGAYGLVKHQPPFARAILNLVVAALMFSPHVTQIPNYLIVVSLGLINTYWALILPKIAVAYNFFLMERFVGQIPDSMLEAARMDGAKEMTVFLRIAMPVLKPAWATVIVFSFISSWNDAFSPLVFINKQAMKTLPLALQTIAGGTATVDLSRQGATLAAALVTTLPTIILFLIMQGKVIQTMAYSGIKG